MWVDVCACGCCGGCCGSVIFNLRPLFPHPALYCGEGCASCGNRISFLREKGRVVMVTEFF